MRWEHFQARRTSVQSHLIVTAAIIAQCDPLSCTPMVREWRRQRRRRAVTRKVAPLLALAGAIAVIVVLLVGAVSQISPSSGPYRRTVDLGYVALANPLAQESNAVAGDLENLLNGGPKLDRVGFFVSLDSVASDASSIERRFARLSPPEPESTAGSSCESSVSLRARAAAGFQGALEQVLGGRTGTGSGAGDTATADAALQSVAQELQGSDREWSNCRTTLRRSPGAALLVGSKWLVRPAQWSPLAIGRFVAAVVASRSLAAAPALRIVNVVPRPAPSPGPGMVVLVPPTESLGLEVVVQDDGNVDEPAVQISATLSPTAAPTGATSTSATASSRSARTSLGAGASVTIQIDALGAAPGSAYSLSVHAVSNFPFAASPAAVIGLQVEQAVSSTVVTASAEEVTAGKPVTYSASVSASFGGLPEIAGTIGFEDDGTPIPNCGSEPLSGSRASCSTSYSSTGTHVITAVYSGDPSRSPSTSAPLIEKVTAPARG